MMGREEVKERGVRVVSGDGGFVLGGGKARPVLGGRG